MASQVTRPYGMQFFLWGYLKAKVFGKPPPRTINALKERIWNEVAAILAVMLQDVMRDHQQRLEECEQLEGRHFTDLIFKK
jgi:hypothetical protein